MGNRAHRHSNSIERLRLAIDCLPVRTREAMLEGIRRNERIIVGAYVDQFGGVCPMLAAHRCGGRTDFLSFAKSWDGFTRAGGRSRPASEREVGILERQLEDSLASVSGLELDRAIAEHRGLRSARMRRAGSLRRLAEPAGEIIARRLRPPRRRATSPGASATEPQRTSLLS
jgi:hypothetical protein